MGKILDDSVSQAKDGTWTFQCPGVTGSLCGGEFDDGKGKGGKVWNYFASPGWDTRKTATARGREHFDEHKGLGPMSSLEEFRAKHGLVQHPDGLRAVRPEDL